MMITHTLCSSNKLFSSPPFPNSPKQENGCCKGLDPKVVDPCEILITHSLLSLISLITHTLCSSTKVFSSLLFSSLLPPFPHSPKQKMGLPKAWILRQLILLRFSSPTLSFCCLQSPRSLTDATITFQMLGLHMCSIRQAPSTQHPYKEAPERGSLYMGLYNQYSILFGNG